jgi:hypothetical protein
MNNNLIRIVGLGGDIQKAYVGQEVLITMTARGPDDFSGYTLKVYDEENGEVLWEIVERRNGTDIIYIRKDSNCKHCIQMITKVVYEEKGNEHILVRGNGVYNILKDGNVTGFYTAENGKKEKQLSVIALYRDKESEDNSVIFIEDGVEIGKYEYVMGEQGRLKHITFIELEDGIYGRSREYLHGVLVFNYNYFYFKVMDKVGEKYSFIMPEKPVIIKDKGEMDEKQIEIKNRIDEYEKLKRVV